MIGSSNHIKKIFIRELAFFSSWKYHTYEKDKKNNGKTEKKLNPWVKEGIGPVYKIYFLLLFT